jgi:cation diffusion facilitator CzcD-associated flavoprotein CzcO
MHAEAPGVRPVWSQEELASRVTQWLQALDAALGDRAVAGVQEMFVDDSYWRDVAALTWDFGWVGGSATLAKALVDGARDRGARGWRLDEGRTPPKIVGRMLQEVIEAFFEFDTTFGTVQGVVRFPVDGLDGGRLRGWTLLTMIRSLHGTPVPGCPVRPSGVGYDRASTKNWSDRRRTESTFDDHDPETVVVGAGHAGLMVAAHLGVLGVDTLVVEKTPRVGDGWRNRYHSLALHNETDMLQFPYLSYPLTFPEYLPKDQLANWLEAYATNLNINVWTSTEFVSGSYDDAEGRWTIQVRREDGTIRELRPRHVVIATGGAGAQPKTPQLPGAESFRGTIVHSSGFDGGADYSGTRALVVGVGTSAHDIALDLYKKGASATMMQRGPTIVIDVKTANLAYPQYSDGTPLDEADLIGAANFIYPLMYSGMQASALAMEQADRELLDRLRAVGMELDRGPDGLGFIYKFLQQGGGYYFDVGASEVIARGDIAMINARDFVRLHEDGVELIDGTHRPIDLVVLATGFHSQDNEARKYFGDDVADRVGRVSSFGDDGELRNAWRPTAQKGLWFMVSGIFPARTYSPVLALQIKAIQQGLVPAYPATAATVAVST